MAGEKAISLMIKAGRAATPPSEKTDLIYGKVISTNPLQIQIANESKLILSKTFLILSEFCKEKRVQVRLPETGQDIEITLWSGLSVGDSVSMLRVLQGSKFYVLQKEVD